MQEIVDRKKAKSARPLSKRVAALENEIDALKAELRLIASRSRDETPGHGLQSMVGLFKDDPGFDEVISLGRKWRRRQR